MSEMSIDINELPKRFGELLEIAAGGSDIIVTQGAIPRARLVVIPQGQRRIAGLHPGAMQMSDDFDAPLPESFWTGS